VVCKIYESRQECTISEGMVMRKLWKHLDPDVLEKAVESGMSVREAAGVVVNGLVGRQLSLSIVISK